MKIQDPIVFSTGSSATVERENPVK